MKEYLDNKGCLALVVFNEKQVIINSFKQCTLMTVATDGSEDLFTYYLKPNQPCAASLELYYIVLKERQDPSGTSEELTCTCYKKLIISYHDLEKIKQLPPLLN